MFFNVLEKKLHKKKFIMHDNEKYLRQRFFPRALPSF